MKKQFSILLLSLFAIVNNGIFAQGIEFEHGSWAEAVAKAKADNKPMLVDFYTTWCGPCRVMAKNVFPVKEVGDKYNASFVNFKVDAEKGEGLQLAKKYEVKNYPTFLFINPADESIIYRESSALSVNDFITMADVALQKGGYAAKGRALDDYRKEFAAGNRQINFIMDYMRQNAMEKQPNVPLSDTLFKYLSPEQRLQQPYIEELALNIGDIMSPLYGFIVANYAAVKKAIKPESILFFNAAVYYATWQSVGGYKGAPTDIIPQRLQQLYEGIKDNPRDVEELYYQLLTKYYQNMRDTLGYLTTAQQYADEVFFPMNKTTLEQADKEKVARYRQQLENGEINSVAFKARTRNPHAIREQAAIRMTNLSIEVARAAKQPADRTFAERLVKHAFDSNPTLENKVYWAVVEQLVGKTKEAKKTMKEVLEEDKKTGGTNGANLEKRFTVLTNFQK